MKYTLSVEKSGIVNNKHRVITRNMLWSGEVKVDTPIMVVVDGIKSHGKVSYIDKHGLVVFRFDEHEAVSFDFNDFSYNADEELKSRQSFYIVGSHSE